MRWFIGLLIGLALLWAAPAQAAEADMWCQTASGTGPNQWGPCSSGNPLFVSASVAVSGFPGSAQSTGTPISVTTGGVSGTLPTGAVVVATNVGTANAAYCKLGAASTTSDQYIAPGGWFAFTVGSATQLTCITSASTTTVNMVGGSGLPTGTGSTTTGVSQGSTTSGQTQALVGCSVTTSQPTYANAQTSPINCDPHGNLRVSNIDPCQSQVATIKPFSITTATTTNIVTGTSSNKIYVCYLYMQSSAANNVAVIEGTTGGTCGSGTAALVGGTTAANGLNNAANGGQAFGSGGYSVLQTQTANNDICIITSANTPLAGALKYVLQ